MKTFLLFSMWLAASAGAIGVAWAGVSVVDNQLIDPPPASIEGPFAGANGFPSPSDSPSGTAGQTGSDTADETNAGVGIGQLQEGDGSPSGTGTPPPSAAAPPSQTSQPAQPTTTAAPTTATPTTATPTTAAPQATPAPTSPPTLAATTQTFSLVGGTAAISFSASGVEVLWATPNPGFFVRIEAESPGIKVEFRADHHRSRVDAWWSNGPQNSIREEPQD